MPQGRRKTPFSGKAKKEQLKAKKEAKAAIKKPLLVHKSSDDEENTVQSLNCQPSRDARSKPNKYALKFYKETDAEIKERKELARHTLVRVSEQELEVTSEDFFPDGIDFPKRPPWCFDMSREQLEANENHYFTEYLNELERKFNWKDLSYFELNLETWRQLWRVIEMSDIFLLIVDVRFPALMFPPSLYEHVANTLKKEMIVVLNKIDLAPPSLVVAWKEYFKNKYPKLHIVMFTTLPGYNLIGKQSDKAGLQVRRRRGRIRMAAEGTQMLFDACKSIVGDELDLTTWQQKIKEEISNEYEDDEIETEQLLTVKNDTSYYEHEKYKSGILTIGCIGQPNVGKSSLMNVIMGKKVVSVSRTPGHTKHFQTIFLTPNVRLCDCPGLVFPSKVPKTLQVLMGSFPIAQLREPFTSVKYLAERLDLPKLLRIEHPEGDDTWSAMDVCDGWAKKRGFLTAKAARLDTYRAANNLLRMALDGKICLCLRPIGYFANKNKWENHEDVKIVRWIQARSSSEETEQKSYDSSESEEELMEGDHNNTESTEDSSDEETPVQIASNPFSALSND